MVVLYHFSKILYKKYTPPNIGVDQLAHTQLMLFSQLLHKCIDFFHLTVKPPQYYQSLEALNLFNVESIKVALLRQKRLKNRQKVSIRGNPHPLSTSQ